MGMKANLDHIAVVLIQPQIPENIGAAARAMHNMGLRRLVLVNPKNCDLCRVVKTATGSSIDVIEHMVVYDDLREALAPYHYVVGTTARTGSSRPTMARPRALPYQCDDSYVHLFIPEPGPRSHDRLLRNPPGHKGHP